MLELILDLEGLSSTQVVEEIDTVAEELRELIIEDFSTVYSMVDLTVNGETLNVKASKLLIILPVVASRALEQKIDGEVIGYDLSIEDFKVTSDIEAFFDESISIFCDNGFDQSIVTKAISVALEKISKVTWWFNEISGSTFNIYDTAHQCMEDEELFDLLNYKVDETLQFSEIEELAEEATDRLIKKIKSNPKNCLSYIVDTVSTKQFQQSMVSISLKPDLNGNVIDGVVNTSFLQGMRNAKDFFINAQGARKALITNA